MSRRRARATGALTKRQKQVLYLMSKSWGNDNIADFLHISPQTVKNHATNIYAKLDVQNRTEAVLKTLAPGCCQPTGGLA